MHKSRKKVSAPVFKAGDTENVQPEFEKDRENWPLWCPCCGNAAPDDPANNWESTKEGLECIGCGATQRWATVDRKREWLKARRRQLGTAFEAWMDMDFHLFHLDLLIRDHFSSLRRELLESSPSKTNEKPGEGRQDAHPRQYRKQTRRGPRRVCDETIQNDLPSN